MMSPESEFQDLLDRAERMWSATLLLLITFSLLLVSSVTLLFTVFVTLFSYLRNGANVLTEKATAGKGVTFRHALRT